MAILPNNDTDMNAQHQTEPEEEHEDASGHADAPGVAGADAATTERVFYRDAAEFNKAMDAAAQSIRTTAGPDILGNVIWWGLIAILIFLYLADGVFGWELRTDLIPGVDLVKPLWLVVVAMIVLHFAWKRSRQPRILRKRLCLRCGTSLVNKPVDDDGGGVCPQCEREFNLGEYQRPNENRGRDFHGYIDASHFDKAIYSAAEQIRKMRGLGFESDLMGWCWLGLGVYFGGAVLFDWDFFDWIPWDAPVNLIWFITLLLWGGWYARRVRKLQPKIIDQRLCMNCGFCLLGAPIDDADLGRCSECGCVFTTAQYQRPPADEGE